MMEKLLEALSGKKGTIATVLSAMNGYLALKGYYGEPEFALISTILVALFGTASLATQKMYHGKELE
jgi:hypothetical protein